MRPGFYIPECPGNLALAPQGAESFNEAGILHPGMPDEATRAGPPARELQ